MNNADAVKLLDNALTCLELAQNKIISAKLALTEPPSEPWTKDLRYKLAYYPGPYRNANLQRDSGWWQRELSDINLVTYHHTLSDSPHAFARYYIQKEGGRPTIPYTIWITQTGEILLCVNLTDGNWHDHTGHRNVHLSVGLAGRLHEYHPAGVQLDAAAKVGAWAVQCGLFPKLTYKGIKGLVGHMDVGTYKNRTECPGWASSRSGHWKPELYDRFRTLGVE